MRRRGRDRRLVRALRALPALGGLLATVGLAAPALANGRFPQASQLVVDPGDPSHLVVRATYGTLHSFDAGATFGWVCEASVGYGGAEDPMMGVLSDGTLLAGTFEGLSVSHDRACSWSFVAGALTSAYVADVVVGAVRPGARAGDRVERRRGRRGGAGAVRHRRRRQDLGTGRGPARRRLVAQTVEVAPSNPGSRLRERRRRASEGLRRPERRSRRDLEAAPLRSGRGQRRVDRRGRSADPRPALRAQWTGAPSIACWSATTAPPRGKGIYVSQGDLTGFALSPDGARLAVGGASDGVRIAATTDFQFQKTSAVGAQCLTWTAAGLYACATEGTDTFTVGLSGDGGQTFHALYHLADTCPLACPAATSTGAQCPAVWPGVQDSIIGLAPSACGGSGGAVSGGTGSGGGAPAAPPAAGGGCAVTGHGWMGLSSALSLPHARSWPVAVARVDPRGRLVDPRGLGASKSCSRSRLAPASLCGGCAVRMTAVPGAAPRAET